MSEFHERFRHIATEFLRTAVVLDDRAYGGSGATGGVLQRPPTRRSYRSERVELTDGRPSHDLNSAELVQGFARHGILCGVLDSVSGAEALDKLVDRADIVVLDWQIFGDEGAFALERIHRLAVDQHRLRIVAVYTGEADLDTIRERIGGSEVAGGRRWEDSASGMLRCGSCYVALYCKEGANPQPGFRDRVVHEGELAESVVNDFVAVAAGLVPAVALTALTSVRDNAYRLLNRFGSFLDPAFLCHRACLPAPDDAETFIVSKVAGEVEEIMTDSVAARRPAGLEAISTWLEARKLSGDARKELQRLLTSDSDRTAQFSSPELRGKGLRKLHRWFTGILAGDAASDVDLAFAWIASHRVVVGQEPKRLQLGTIVRRRQRGVEEFYVCIRPRCDSVRLTGLTPFLFLALTEGNGGKGVATLVVKSSDGFVRKTVKSTPFVQEFAPLGDNGVVVTQVGESENHYYVDCDGTEFDWMGELRQEFAQRIVQRYGSHLGRVAVEDTEWLRRIAGDG